MSIMLYFKLFLSIVFGFLLGLERELHGKSVGIKTVALITLGSTLFVLMSPKTEDYSRIIAQIVSGVSFICAGVLIKDKNHISGLTTSSILWSSAAIGCLIGLNFYLEASIGTLCIILITWGFPRLKILINDKRKISKIDSEQN